MRPVPEYTLQRGTLKSLLVPILTHPRVAQIIKWSVYGLLTVNFGIYAYDDYMAYLAAVAPDAPWSEVFESFPTTLDVAAWLGLVLIFELETYVLEDEAFAGGLGKLLMLLRAILYAVIVYAAVSYYKIAVDNYQAIEIAGLSDLCQVSDQGLDIQLDAITYVEVTAANCDTLAAGPPFYRIDTNVSLIDGQVLQHVQKLAWVDLANSITWILIVLLIEVEVWLQAADRFGSRALARVRTVKTGLYGVLMINVVIWLSTGYPMWSYDSLLWIFGFWAIELNLVEWELERMEEMTRA